MDVLALLAGIEDDDRPAKAASLAAILAGRED
jgi:hypothetical protein